MGTQGKDLCTAGFEASKQNKQRLDSLDTVRALHETVVALRSALETSKVELEELRASSNPDPEVLRQTVERLSLENHVLRERVLADQLRSIAVETAKTSDITQTQKDNFPDVGRKTEQIIMEPTSVCNEESESDCKQEVEETSVPVALEQRSVTLENLDQIANGPDAVEEIREELKQQVDNAGSNEDKGVNTVDTDGMFDKEIKCEPPEKSESNECHERDERSESEEEEEVDDIELIFTTDDTKEMPTLQETLESITEDGPWDRNGVPILLKYRAVNEFDPVAEEEEYCSKQRRNTLPGSREYRPIAHREVIQGSRSQVLSTRGGASFLPSNNLHHGDLGPVRPILMERSGHLSAGNKSRESTGAQTDITALPLQWKSESYLARHKVVAQNFTTLPSKFAIPAAPSRPLPPSTTGLRLSEKTREARRALLSDLGFTSMVPELSRSVDHLCRRGDAMLARSFPRALSYMKQIDSADSSLSSPAPRNGRWLCECLAHAGSSYYPGMWDSTGSSLMQRPPMWSPLTPHTPCDRGNSA